MHHVHHLPPQQHSNHNQKQPQQQKSRLASLLVVVPSHANYTTDGGTHHKSDISDSMVNLVFGPRDRFRKTIVQSVS